MQTIVNQSIYLRVTITLLVCLLGSLPAYAENLLKAVDTIDYSVHAVEIEDAMSITSLSDSSPAVPAGRGAYLDPTKFLGWYIQWLNYESCQS